jgi:hypothetical protein
MICVDLSANSIVFPAYSNIQSPLHPRLPPFQGSLRAR